MLMYCKLQACGAYARDTCSSHAASFNAPACPMQADMSATLLQLWCTDSEYGPPAVAPVACEAGRAVQASAEFQQLVAMHQSEDGAPVPPEIMHDPAAIARHLVTTNFPGFVGELQGQGAASVPGCWQFHGASDDD